MLGSKKHPELTLARRFREARKRWLEREDIIQNEEDLVQFVDPQNGWGGFIWLDGMPCVFPLAPRQSTIVKGAKGPQARAGLRTQGRKRQDRSPVGL